MKKVIITGSNGGLGKSLVTVFKNNSWDVIGIDKHQNNKSKAKFYINFDFDNILNDPMRNQLIDEIKKIIKNDLNCLINNAAIQVIKPIEKIKRRDLVVSLNVNFYTPFFLTQLMLPMLKKTKGKVINIGSIHNQRSIKRFFPYHSSKLAQSSIINSFAIEHGKDITFMQIDPGAINTNMLRKGVDDNEFKKLLENYPTGKIIEPIDLANFIYEMSVENRYFLNGSFIATNCGVGNKL